MTESSEREAFMIYVINLFADRFGNHAILKGGMELRLLNCPRHTNDVDYTFIPFDSKNDVRTILEGELKDLSGIDVDISLNSKCLVCRLSRQGVRVQVEINASLKCKSEELSTMEISKMHQQQGRIIRAMSLDTALAFKLAAWNERRLARDLYDIYFIDTLAGIHPDKEMLKERLLKVLPARGGKSKKKSMTLEDLAEEIEGQIQTLDQVLIESGLRDYLPHDYLPGLEYKIKISLGRIVEYIRS